MRRKLLIGGLGVAAALMMPGVLGSTGSTQALECPNAALADVCGAADLVLSTVCYTGLPALPSVPGLTVEVDNGPLVICPELPV